MSKYAVYRHYDADGVLLYVGMSLNPTSRNMAHKAGSYWFCDISKITIEWFQDKIEAMDAEAWAIYREKPIYNKNLLNGGSTKPCVVKMNNHQYDAINRSAKFMGLDISTFLKSSALKMANEAN